MRAGNIHSRLIVPARISGGAPDGYRTSPGSEARRFVSHPPRRMRSETKLLADAIGIGKRTANGYKFLCLVSGFDREENSMNRFSIVKQLFGKPTYYSLVATATVVEK